MQQLADDEYLFTSESVTEGHPDKMADQISDAVLDAALAADPESRVACETLVTTGLAVIAGEITTTAKPDFTEIVRDTICGIGYNTGEFGFDGHHCAVMVCLDKQSPDIAQGVDSAHEHAARHVAKNIVAAGLADRAEVQVAYAIGVARPLSMMVETFGTERIPRSRIVALVEEHFDLRPAAFGDALKLHRPIYKKTAAYGHFGRDDDDFTWEHTDKADVLRAAAGLGS